MISILLLRPVRRERAHRLLFQYSMTRGRYTTVIYILRIAATVSEDSGVLLPVACVHFYWLLMVLRERTRGCPPNRLAVLCLPTPGESQSQCCGTVTHPFPICTVVSGGIPPLNPTAFGTAKRSLA